MKASAKENKFRSITARWIVGSLFWSVLILLAAEFALFFLVKQNYYNSAQQALELRLKLSTSSIPTSQGQTDADRYDYVMSLVENFSEKDKFELMLVNSYGVPLMTSSGFPFKGTEELNSLAGAYASADGVYTFFGESGSGENVVAVTELLAVPARDVYAIRVVSSLQIVDKEISQQKRVMVLVGLLVFAVSILSGSYFIRSIVLPIRRIGVSANKIAGGDFDIRIESKYADEIGNLCDKINDMAAGLSEADRIKNEFISSVSHELRTPLTSIKGWAETLAAVGPDDRETFDKGMEIVKKETERLSAMVEDLLDFSRFSRGDIPLNKEEIDLIAELSDSVLTVSERAKKSGITISFSEDEQPAKVFADRNRMKQVFVNILDNAIKYTPEGGSIEVKTSREDGKIVVSVIDSGIGIKVEELPNVTQKFYKGSNSAKGSGIGLALVKELVEGHNGSLAIDSELGRGTTVTVTLPIKK